MRVVVIGAGAIGGVVAAYLAKSGTDVTLVCHDLATANLVQSRGIHIEGRRGEHNIRLNAVSKIEALKEPYDVCLIVTKAYDLEEAAKKVLPFLDADALVVSMQNGMCLEILESIIGKARAVACIVSWSSTQLAPASLDITGEGSFIIGRSNGKIDKKINELKLLLDNVAPTVISENILAEKYSKLIINSGITAAGAITGQTLGKMLKSKIAREFFIALVDEDIALAKALGIKVPPFGGKLDYYRFLAGNSIFDKSRRHLLLLAIGFKYRKLTSSSLTALRRGRKTEVAYLNGWICEQAKKHKVPVPTNELVCKLTNEIEAGERKIRPENLVELMKMRDKFVFDV